MMARALFGVQFDHFIVGRGGLFKFPIVLLKRRQPEQGDGLVGSFPVCFSKVRAVGGGGGFWVEVEDLQAAQDFVGAFKIFPGKGKFQERPGGFFLSEHVMGQCPHGNGLSASDGCLSRLSRSRARARG